MYNMYVLFDTQGNQKTKAYSCEKVTYVVQNQIFFSNFFNVITGSHTAYFSKCIVIKDSIASVTVVITVVSFVQLPLDQLAPWTN